MDDVCVGQLQSTTRNVSPSIAGGCRLRLNVVTCVTKADSTSVADSSVLCLQH